jgi:hypothetical protein
VEPGDYQAKAHSLQWMTNEFKGERTTRLEVEFHTADKRSISWRCSFGSAKAVDFAKKQLRVAGWKGDDVTRIRSASDIPDEVTIRIKMGEYNGKPQLRISIVTPFDASPATPDDMKRLASKISGVPEAPASAFTDDPAADDTPF